MIKKSTVQICYAHRVWRPEHTFNVTGAFLHGHTATINITSDIGNSKHRDVEDRLNTLFAFLMETVNGHCFIDHADPMFYTLVMSIHNSSLVSLFPPGASIPDVRILTEKRIGDIATDAFVVDMSGIMYPHKRMPVGDLLSSYLIFNFSPSADNLARWVFGIASKVLVDVAVVKSVEFTNIGGDSFEVSV